MRQQTNFTTLRTGNPARRCRLSFCSEIDENFSKIKYGVNIAVKLEFKVIIVQRSVSTISLCKKNGQNSPILSVFGVFSENIVRLADRLLLLKCYDNKKV